MKPFATRTLRAAALASLAAGLWAMSAMPTHAQVYRCTENGQTAYSDRPCGTRATQVPLIDNTPTAADQQAARERAKAEAAEVREMETTRRKSQAAEEARQAQIAAQAAQAAEQARREQRQKVVVAQEGVRYCHRVYIGPVPYPMPMPVITPPPTPAPAPATGALRLPNNGPKPFAQAPTAPHIVPRPPRPHPPHYRIVCEPGYVYEGPEDLLPVQ